MLPRRGAGHRGATRVASADGEARSRAGAFLALAIATARLPGSRPTEAESHFEHALEICDRQARRPLAAEIRYHRAAELDARDARHRLADLTQASAEFRAMGMRWWSDRTAALAEEPGIEGNPRDP